jgi:TetR/AcrR family transcriptional regulator, cholesterol catabolism regulator
MEKFNDILKKISELFRTYGIKSVTMDDVAKELGISKKTLYQYVDDKTDLINKLIDYEIEGTEACFNQIINTRQNAIEELFEMNRFIISMLKRYSLSFDYDLKKYYPEIFQKIFTIRRNNILHATLANLKKGKIEGLYREELNEEILARLHISRMENMRSNSLFTAEEINSGEVFKEMVISHIRGIANEKGIKFLEQNMHRLDYTEKEIFEQKDEL